MARAVAKKGRSDSSKGGLLEGAFEEALEGIAAALAGEEEEGRGQRRQLPFLALVSARAFFRFSPSDSETISSASAALARAWEGKDEQWGGAGAAAPVAVPVAALGADAAAEDDVAVEVHFERVFEPIDGGDSSSD